MPVPYTRPQPSVCISDALLPGIQPRKPGIVLVMAHVLTRWVWSSMDLLTEISPRRNCNGWRTNNQMTNQALARSESFLTHETQTRKKAQKSRKKFLKFFPKGFNDDTYLAWERDYKWEAHKQWSELLNPPNFRSLLRTSDFDEIAARAVRIESRTNLLF